MAFQLYIDGADKSDKVDWQSIEIKQVLTKQPDEMRFLIRYGGSKTYRPNLGEEVIFWRNLTDKLFAGVIVEIHESIEAMQQSLQIVCKDYTEILDGQLVAKTYENKTVSFIINDLMNNFAYGLGFTTGNAVSNIVVDKVQFNYMPISKCLEKLADYLLNYDWFVDYYKDIHFFNTIFTPAPFSLTDDNGNYIWDSLEIKNESHQIRNEIYIRGGEIRSVTPRSDLFDGDGVKQIFVLGNKYPEKPTVIVDGLPRSVGIDYVDVDAGFHCMWDFNRRTIRFTAGNTPGVGVNNVVVSGLPLYPLIFRKRDEGSILNYGLKQHLIVDKTIASINSASQRSDKELAKFGTPARIGTFRTYRDGLRPGHIITIQSAIRNNLNENFKITGVQARLHNHDTLEYTCNILASEDIGINDVLTDLLVKGPAEELEGGYEFIQRYVNFYETVTGTDALSQPTKSYPPYFWAPSGNDLIWTFGTWS